MREGGEGECSCRTGSGGRPGDGLPHRSAPGGSVALAAFSYPAFQRAGCAGISTRGSERGAGAAATQAGPPGHAGCSTVAAQMHG